MRGCYTGLRLFGRFSVRVSFLVVWSNGTQSFCMRLRNGGSNAVIDGFVTFDLGGCKIAVIAISIRSREKVGSNDLALNPLK